MQDSSSENLLKNAIAVPISPDQFPSETLERNELIISGRTKRAIKPFKRHETIRIVPGGYEHIQRKRRNVVIDYKTANEQKIQECCSHRKCVCDESKCERMRPECDDDQILLLVHKATESPGDCCSEYRCDIKPNCANETDHPGVISVHSNRTEIEWISNCKRCKCQNGESICEKICEINEPTVESAPVAVTVPDVPSEPAGCYSSNHDRHYARNATWNEDDCTRCMCAANGTPICHSSVCKPKNCAKLIRLPGQCCPVCDLRDSKYCAGQSDCGIVCRYGLDVNPITGCQVCKCKSWPPSQTSVQPPAYPEIDATMDTNIVHNDNTDFNLILYLPVLVIICMTIIIFMFVMGLMCKYLHYNKDKYCVNKKMYDNNLTPLI